MPYKLNLTRFWMHYFQKFYEISVSLLTIPSSLYLFEVRFTDPVFTLKTRTAQLLKPMIRDKNHNQVTIR